MPNWPKRRPSAEKCRRTLARFNDEELEALANELAERAEIPIGLRRGVVRALAAGELRTSYYDAAIFTAFLQAFKPELLPAPGGGGDTPRRRRAFAKERKK
jgi:hypothetical protein